MTVEELTVEELTVRVARGALERGHDQTPVNDTYAKWCACVSMWGADSPPALGCLLALVREAWGPDARVHVMPTRDGEWIAWRDQQNGFDAQLGRGENEAAALVAALEAAP